MAAAIAEDLIVRGNDSLRHVHAISAGASAQTGAPMTPEAAEALRGLGIDPPRHRASGLTRELIETADVVFGMTGRHVDAVLQFAPDASQKTHTLDPGGEDVPDPVGQSQEIYNRTAERLKALIADRLREIEKP